MWWPSYHQCSICYCNLGQFCEAYSYELTQCPNIHALGYLDVEGNEFRKMAEVCCFMLAPSCAEACSGAVLAAMSAGIIPIASRICGFEDGEIEIIADCEEQTLRDAILHASAKSMDQIKQESEHVRDLIRSKYSQEGYIKSITNAFKCLKV